MVKKLNLSLLKSLRKLSKNFIKHLFDYLDNLVAKNMHKSNKKFRKFLIQNDKINHGCFYRNKSCTRKLTDFERGEIWVCPTSNRYWSHIWKGTEKNDQTLCKRNNTKIRAK